MARTAMISDLATRLEALEAKAKIVRGATTLPKGEKRDRLRALKFAAGAILAKLRRTDALDPRRSVSLETLAKHIAETPEAGGMVLPALGEIVSIDGELRRVVA